MDSSNNIKDQKEKSNQHNLEGKPINFVTPSCFRHKDTFKYEAFLKEHAVERMDANRYDIFHKLRCDFHTDRYRFACEYSEGKDIIDCASGLGYGANILRSLGRAKSVVGVEINKDAAEYASYMYGDDRTRFLNGSILDLPFEDNSFDLFTSFETIEHVENEKKQLSEIQRVLKNNGIYICSTPNDWKLGAANPYHVKDYTYETLLETFKAPFEIVKIYNQNSGIIGGYNHDQPRGITLTTEENHSLAECFIIVCKVIKE